MTYPLGVIAAGLQSVFDYRPTYSGPLTQNTDANIPGNSWIDGVTMFSYVPAWAVSAFRFTKYMYLNGGSFRATNFEIKQLGGGLYAFALGHQNGAAGAPADLILSDGVVDMDNTDFNNGSCFVRPGSTLTATRVSFLRPSVRHLFANGNTTLTDCYWSSPAHNTTPQAHAECLYLAENVHTIRRNFFDARDMAGSTLPVTGLIAALAENPLTINMYDSILMGVAGIGGLSPVQLAHDVTFNLWNCVFEAGLSGGEHDRYIISTPGGGTITVNVMSNCYDCTTGAVINSLLEMASSAGSVDLTPDPFSFTDRTAVSLSTVYTSNAITVSDINAPTAISITPGGLYSINGGTFTSVIGTVVNGDHVAVKVTSSASAFTAVSTTLTIGGVSDTFTVTTAPEAPPVLPPPSPPVNPAPPAAPAAGVVVTTAPAKHNTLSFELGGKVVTVTVAPKPRGKKR